MTSFFFVSLHWPYLQKIGESNKQNNWHHSPRFNRTDGGAGLRRIGASPENQHL